MAIAEKQARVMALERQLPSWLNFIGSIEQCLPAFLPLFVFLSFVLRDIVGDIMLDICLLFIDFFPIILLIEIVCTLRGYTSMMGAIKRTILIGPLSALGLLSTVRYTIAFGSFVPHIESVESWISLYFGLLPLSCGTVLFVVFASYFTIANHDNILLIGDLIALAMMPVLFIVPYFFSFVMLAINDVFGLEGLPEYQIQLLAAFLLVFPTTFVLFEQIAVIALARAKKQWSDRFFFGNDINEKRCFVIPAKPSSYRGMRSWVWQRRAFMVEVPAKFFLVQVERPWGETYRHGSIVRNLAIYFCEKMCIYVNRY